MLYYPGHSQIHLHLFPRFLRVHLFRVMTWHSSSIETEPGVRLQDARRRLLRQTPIMELINGQEIDTRSAETDWSHLVLIELPRITIKPTQNDIGSVNCLAYRRAPSTASSNDLFWLFSVQLEKHDSTWPHYNYYSLSALRNHAWVEIMIDVRSVVWSRMRGSKLGQVVDDGCVQRFMNVLMEERSNEIKLNFMTIEL